jgi:hypothetical protein
MIPHSVLKSLLVLSTFFTSLSPDFFLSLSLDWSISEDDRWKEKIQLKQRVAPLFQPSLFPPNNHHQKINFQELSTSKNHLSRLMEIGWEFMKSTEQRLNWKMVPRKELTTIFQTDETMDTANGIWKEEKEWNGFEAKSQIHTPIKKNQSVHHSSLRRWESFWVFQKSVRFCLNIRMKDSEFLRSMTNHFKQKQEGTPSFVNQVSKISSSLSSDDRPNLFGLCILHYRCSSQSSSAHCRLETLFFICLVLSGECLAQIVSHPEPGVNPAFTFLQRSAAFYLRIPAYSLVCSSFNHSPTPYFSFKREFSSGPTSAFDAFRRYSRTSSFGTLALQPIPLPWSWNDGSSRT